MKQKTVLATRAKGYISDAVAKAFRRAGWRTFRLVRRQESPADLVKHEIHPIIGSSADLSF